VLPPLVFPDLCVESFSQEEITVNKIVARGDVGFHFSLEDPQEIPLIRDHATLLSPGFHFILSVSMRI
jgi:hypothetical protein